MPGTARAQTDNGTPESELSIDAPDSFAAFYGRESLWARRLALVLVGNVEAAEDLSQEAFVRLHRRFNRIDNPRAYLRVALVNLCHRYRRSEQQRQQQLTTCVIDTAQISSPSIEVLDLVDRLPPRQRDVLVLRYFEDLSEAEIAQALHCRPGTVKSLASRALRQIHQEMSQ